MSKHELNLIHDLVFQLIESGDELKDKKERNECEFGVLLGYMEALRFIQTSLTEEEVKSVGLNFDVDEWYLNGRRKPFDY